MSMNPAQFKTRLLEILEERENRPISSPEISSLMQLRSKEKKTLPRWLQRLVAEGVIVRIRHGRYAIGDPADLVTGTISITRAGDGWIGSREGGPDLFVPSRRLRTALPGDTVVARRDTRKTRDDGKATGEVVRVVERGREQIVGTLKTTGKFFYVVPLDPAYTHDIYVPDAHGAVPDDRVVVHLTGWENRHLNPEAEIMEVLGPVKDPSLDTIAVIRHHELRDTFSPAVLEEAEAAVALAETPGEREDLRDRCVVTIDPVDARDFDDALSLERDGDGQRVLGVHIADVAHFVRPGGELDAEARRRGNSVYLADKVLPMLPETLSNGICSLRPDEDRLAFSVFLTIDNNGEVVRARTAKSLIRSSMRLTYRQALAVLEGEGEAAEGAGDPMAVPAGIRRLLTDLHELAGQFRKARFAGGALDLDMPELEIVLGDDGMMTGYHLVSNDVSHQLVEECMLAANEAVARELSDKRVRAIARLHEAPDADRLAEVAEGLRDVGFHPGNLAVRRNLVKFLQGLSGHPLADYARTAVLRSMKRACYSSTGTGHFGLAKERYTHFTSPIRRYPDLVVHRLLFAMLQGDGSNGYDRSELKSIAFGCTATEATADDAERSLMEIKKYRYLERQIETGDLDVYEAVVSRITNFGMFIEVPELMLRGLVHISAISESFVRHDRGNDTLRAGKESYGIGTSLRVSVAKVDMESRKLDFFLVEEPTSLSLRGTYPGFQENRG